MNTLFVAGPGRFWNLLHNLPTIFKVSVSADYEDIKQWIQNLGNWVVFDSYGSLKITENSAIR